MKKLLAVGLLGCLSWSAQADWVLDNANTAVSFVTIKLDHIAEIGSFKQLTGNIDDQGQAEVKIDLTSVDTLIPIRDERMQAHLFKTETYAHATITAQLDAGKLDGLAAGQMMSMDFTGQLNLHGEDQEIKTTVTVSRLSDNQLLVASQKPIVVNAEQYKLANGVNKLREIAGLPSISYAVPVNFVLSFNNQ
ncbi:YceI family protein [Candidatus Albibeggiatoa sp. nov. NOAA]|uniref:YceI family protein n=1 Tax=Candidatus Albibeggiatoa sp. nov. NOAA TaxID=3162724 RepID=UPI0032F79F11|nr:YceI family protein [Thiotrichaceae bacterium]